MLFTFETTPHFSLSYKIEYEYGLYAAIASFKLFTSFSWLCSWQISTQNCIVVSIFCFCWCLLHVVYARNKFNITLHRCSKCIESVLVFLAVRRVSLYIFQFGLGFNVNDVSHCKNIVDMLFVFNFWLCSDCCAFAFLPGTNSHAWWWYHYF